MNLDRLLSKLGEWLRGTGPESDVVVSTRIRLARNLADHPFTNRANLHQKSEVEAKIRDCVTKLEVPGSLSYIDISKLDAIDRQFLVERQLISRELANVMEGPRGAAFDERESVSLMVNEEDQLRLQVMRSGLALEAAWEEIDRIDDMIEAKLNYAFHEQFGYLTACPTNVGTGMRASVKLHLPALGMTKQIEKAFKALQKINLVVRGLYGEGSRASGDFYQISNQITLGKSEASALADIREVITEILRYERMARTALVRENRQALLDRVARAVGTLQSATMMTSEETMELLSSVRLGIHLKLLDDVSLQLVNELFLHSQPAHLQKLMGEPLDGEARNSARARYLRSRLRELGASAN
ncbi:MAG: protein arginine kinase [Planctomycetes bacterium]|nr:protein arginine kinase [Planctomycetota bacterium]